MKSFTEFVTETSFADLRPKTGQWKQIPVPVMKKAQQERSPNIDTELFDLLDLSYAYIGGHVNFKKPSDIPHDYTLWYAVDLNGDNVPDALKFAKPTAHGTKWTGGATDGSAAAKTEYVNNTVKALTTPGHFCEMSDAIMHIMITRYRVPCVDNQKDVEKVLGKQVKWVGKHPEGKYPGWNGFYVRELGGHPHMKILLGKPNV